MTTKQKVLQYLMEAAPEPVSGQFIADQLHFSRNTIWKAIEELRSLGYQIEQQHKKGYFLASSVTDLEETQLKIGLQKLVPELLVEAHNSVTSTNDLAKIHAAQQPNNPTLILAKEQTQGRGRHGRSFHSALKNGLYLSLVIKPSATQLDDLPLYTIMTAVALTKALENYLPDPIAIKWINDLFYKGKKISGILCESIMDLESYRVNNLVIGVGINLAGSFANTEANVQSVAGTLFGETIPSDFNYNTFIISFIKHFFDYHRNFNEKGFLPYYADHMLGLNQQVYFEQQGKKRHGIIRGINEWGHLIIDNEQNERESLFSSEIHFSSQQFTNPT